MNWYRIAVWVKMNREWIWTKYRGEIFMSLSRDQADWSADALRALGMIVKICEGPPFKLPVDVPLGVA